MNPRAVNLAWWAACLPSERAFTRALADPRGAQSRVLREVLRGTRGTALGREHGLDRVTSVPDFRAAVPVRDWEALEPWLARVAAGEPRVLTREPVRVLEPTSGSTSAEKLVPWTRGLQRQLRRAVGPWIADLFRANRALVGGPAYWAVSPRLPREATGAVALPVGFQDDAAYLGGLARCLAGGVLAVPSSVARTEDQEQWTYATLAGLLTARELRLISVWHPSFLTLLFDGLAPRWEELLRLVADGGGRAGPAGRAGRANRARARELERLGPADPRALWPRLTLVSAWGDGPAAPAFAALRERLPGVRLQAKGLLATEATVTIPFRGARPLALRSHFFEFEAEDGSLHLAHELAPGAAYVVIVSTAGGLLRYRLGDRVRVLGRLGRTPSLEFLEREGAVSDLRGEKLSEGFVAGALADLLRGSAREHAELVACAGDPPYYALVLRAPAEPGLAERLDLALAANPHYAGCRRSGQLAGVRIAPRRTAESEGGALSDSTLRGAKPRVLTPVGRG